MFHSFDSCFAPTPFARTFIVEANAEKAVSVFAEEAGVFVQQEAEFEEWSLDHVQAEAEGDFCGQHRAVLRLHAGRIPTAEAESVVDVRYFIRASDELGWLSDEGIIMGESLVLFEGGRIFPERLTDGD